jgi:hypothetical protein
MFLHYWKTSVAISGVVPREHRAQHTQGLSRIELSYATDGRFTLSAGHRRIKARPPSGMIGGRFFGATAQLLQGLRRRLVNFR